jgi:hypothetical protein
MLRPSLQPRSCIPLRKAAMRASPSASCATPISTPMRRMGSPCWERAASGQAAAAPAISVMSSRRFMPLTRSRRHRLSHSAGPLCSTANGRREMSKWAINDQSAPQQKDSYSITSSARASSDCGMVRPSALAVFRLMTRSYLVGACTGRSAAFSPLRMRST